MFGKEKIMALEAQLTSMRGKMEAAIKERKDLQDQLQKMQDQLKHAKDKVQELEAKVAESELTELKEKARQTIVEYEGLKELYQQKNREIDATRESTEEGFAREAASKRQNLADEIEQNREGNRQLVTETIKTFAGSYRYYLDQIRVLTDALSQAARETGENLFKGEIQDIRESFGSRIVNRLRNDADSLRQNNGDKLLIGAEEPVDESEEPCGTCEAEEAADAAAETEADAEELSEPEEAPEEEKMEEAPEEEMMEEVQELTEKAAEDVQELADVPAEENEPKMTEGPEA